jgi:hAT family C-terminal dimerisation region
MILLMMLMRKKSHRHRHHHHRPKTSPSIEQLWSAAALNVTSGIGSDARYKQLSEALTTMRKLFESMDSNLQNKPELINPLYFWRNQASTFDEPIASALVLLASFVRIFLATPATSAVSESLFSVAGFEMSKRRNRLDVEALCAITLIVRNQGLFPSCNDFKHAVAREVYEQLQPRNTD